MGPWAGHGPGNNVFAYFCGPDEVLLEYTAEVLQIDDSYEPRPSSYWKFAPGRSDQWASRNRVRRVIIARNGCSASPPTVIGSLDLIVADGETAMTWGTTMERENAFMRRGSFILLAVLLSLGAWQPAAKTDDWPDRPIRVLTTASPGGISDVFMHALGEKLGARLGKPIVVENRPGGMQNVGARACQDSEPDGYTICIVNADPLIYNQFLIRHMPFDPEKGLQPITKLFDLIHVMVVNSDFKVKNVDELIALSKAKPGTLSYLTPGAPMVLYMETLKKERGADWVRVPFKGGGEAVNAILSGFTPIGLFGEGNVVGQIRAGTMTPLVMLNNIHSPNFPQVPTLKETGYDGPPSRGWYGLFAPAGTPRAIVDRLAKEVAAIVADPDFAQRQLKDRSLVGSTNTPDEFAQEIVADRKVAEQVVKQAGMGPE